MKLDTKVTLVAVGLILVVSGGIYGLSIAVDEKQQQQSDDSQVVNESNVPDEVLESKDGATALKESFITNYDYQNNVSIQPDGQIILSYGSDAQNGNQLKDEMKQVALLYSDVAAEHESIGALTIRANGVMLTVPADTAIAHGQGDINEEAYFETVRFDAVGEQSDGQ